MSKIIKRIITVICVVTLFIGCGEGFKYILVDDTASYTRLSLHQLYNSEKNIDVLFVGSSHVYRSLIPEITDDIFGAYTFNAGTSSQAMDGSLAMIKEAVTYNNVSQIYLELYYGVAGGGAYKDRVHMTATYIISDYMKPSLRKLQYLMEASSKEHYINSFILARRNWEKIFDSEYVKNLVQRKQMDSYKNYEWVRYENQIEYYVERGFVANDGVVAEDTYWNSMAYDEIVVPTTVTQESDWSISLQSIINYCSKNDIELTLFIAPEPEWTVIGKGNYQAYHDMISEIANENNLKFYDFNLCKPEFFQLNDRRLFKDEDHLNTNGAKVFSELFAKFFTGQIKEENLFYDTYEEKLAAEPPIVYGVAGPKENEEEGVKYARIISNRTEGIEYQIVVTPEAGEQRVIQNFAESKDFSLPIDEHGMLDISWRLIDNADMVQTIKLAY